MRTKTTVVRNAATMAATALGALGLCACATIIHSPRQQVAISSTPAGATISIDNKEVGQTPLVTRLARRDEHVLRIELAGYQPFQATLHRKVSGWVLGNIVFGGLVGLAIDAVSGGMYELRPDQVSAALTSGQARIERRSGELTVLTVLEPQPDWMKVAQLQRD